jgi:hypothetical protein
VFHFRRTLREWEAIEGTGGEEFAEFAPSFGVAGDTGVEVMAEGEIFGRGVSDYGRSGPEFYTEYWFDIAFTAFFDPCYGAGGIVNIGEGQGCNATQGGAFCQLLGREGAVFEGII